MPGVKLLPIKTGLELLHIKTELELLPIKTRFDLEKVPGEARILPAGVLSYNTPQPGALNPKARSHRERKLILNSSCCSTMNETI